MAGVSATSTVLESNYVPADNSRVLINRLANPNYHYNPWTSYVTLNWTKYQIKETDMRVKTATFTSDTYLDLTTGTYCVLITSPSHEDFGGIILSVEKDTGTGLYNYQCQDFTRFYMDKWELVINKVSLHRVIKYLISGGNIPGTGDITAKQKLWSKELSGLKPAYQYEQKYWGSTVNFNPMTNTVQAVVKGKSTIELLRDLVIGTGAYIDVYANKYGIIQFEPYHKTDWLKSCVEVPFEAIQDMKVAYDTTNIISGVNVLSNDQLGSATDYTSEELVGIDLSAFVGSVGATVTSSKQTTTTTTTSTASKTTSKKSTSTSNSKKTTSNPYNTKKKQVFINSDNITSKSADKTFMNNLANKLKKQGWTTKVVGVGPNFHSEKYAKKYKNGVWFCIYGGADAAVFRETVGKNSYTNTLKKNNLRTVIGMRSGCDIRKGGKCYKYLKRAHDDNYSPSSFKGISYPLNTLTKGKVPIMYASTVDNMVAKFLKGGDNPKAC